MRTMTCADNGSKRDHFDEHFSISPRSAAMPKTLNMLNTIRGSRLEGFYPRGWDLARIDRCCAMSLKQLTTRAKFWHRDFKAIAVDEIAAPMGDAIADVVERTRR